MLYIVYVRNNNYILIIYVYINLYENFIYNNIKIICGDFLKNLLLVIF